MPQSLANLLTHIIFSRKNRESLLAGKDRLQRVHAYLTAVSKDRKCPAVIVGGIANHVHGLCQLAKTESISNLMEEYRLFLKRYRVVFDERYVWD